MKKKVPLTEQHVTDQPAKSIPTPMNSLFKAAIRDPKVAKDVIRVHIPILAKMVL